MRVNYTALEQKTPRHADTTFFLKAGWYRDYPFHCRDCRKLEIWTDTQQKWWYEVAKGGILTCATRCRACRKSAREKQAEHRRKTAEGYAKKKAQRP